MWIVPTAMLALVCAAAAQTTRPDQKAGSTAASKTDLQLEKGNPGPLCQIKDRREQFSGTVRGGVATLEGRTAVLQHKGTATRLAKSSGARQVVNRIEVAPEARERASANLATGRRRAR